MRHVLQERLPHPQAGALDDVRYELQAGRREHDDRRAVVEVAQLLTTAERRVAADLADRGRCRRRRARRAKCRCTLPTRIAPTGTSTSDLAPSSSAMGMITRSLRQYSRGTRASAGGFTFQVSPGT